MNDLLAMYRKTLEFEVDILSRLKPRTFPLLNS